MLASFGGRPLSRGSVHASTPSINDPPHICGNYLTDPQDLSAAGEGVRLCREIIAQTALDAVRGAELSPGPAIRSTSDLHQFVRSIASPAYHAAGTCRMAANPAHGVVDARLRIHGLDGLRIADASVMPAITAANPHATCLIIGEKAADMILAA